MVCEMVYVFFSKPILPTVLPKTAINEGTISRNFSASFNCCTKWINDIPVIKDFFTIKSQLGQGTFGIVYLVSLRKHPESLFALKHILSISSPQKIENEIRCLLLLRGCDNIISLQTFYRYNNHVFLAMPFIKHDKFKDFFSTLTLNEVQTYMKSLFQALVSVHELGIIHRDIKPGNCLYNCKERKLILIDFGLAQKENELKYSIEGCNVKQEHSVKCCNNSLNPDKCQQWSTKVCSICLQRPMQKSPRCGTSGFRAPEVLLKYPYQTTSIDIWSAGVILLCFLSGKYPFFKGINDNVAMMEIVSLFGTESCIAMAKHLGKELKCSPAHHAQSLAFICDSLRRKRPTLLKVNHDSNTETTSSCNISEGLCSITSSMANQNFTLMLAYDLLEKCLDLNPFTRITASQALQHPF